MFPTKWLLTGIACLVLAPACALSQDTVSTLSEKFPDLIQLTPPGDDSLQQSKIYIDSVRLVSLDGGEALLIQGSLPDGCTHIGSADHILTESHLSLSINAWRDPDLFCTQALVSFSYIYRKVPDHSLKMFENVFINGESYSLQDNRK